MNRLVQSLVRPGADRCCEGGHLPGIIHPSTEAVLVCPPSMGEQNGTHVRLGGLHERASERTNEAPPPRQ